MAFSSSSSEANVGESHRFHHPASGISGTSRTQSRGGQGQSGGLQFDILHWYPKYQSCQKYFLDHAQHDVLVQAFAAFINILLPCQWRSNAVISSTGNARGTFHSENQPRNTEQSTSPPTVSLVPYIRRLVATGMDVPQVLHGFFGDDWAAGIGPQREQERRNFLFAAKSGGWCAVKRDYDMGDHESIPFLRPLHEPTDGEIEAAEKTWSEWLALEDWMLGSRAPG